MRFLAADELKNLSFPDFDVEKMEFSDQKKELMVLVEGAWLDCDRGGKLRNGVLHLRDWKKVVVKSFDPSSKKWTPVNNFLLALLKNLPEVDFSPSLVRLCGFSKQTGLWVEWAICDAKVTAEFNE